MIYTNLMAYRQTFNATLQRWNVPKRKEVLSVEKINNQRKHRWVGLKKPERFRGNGKPYFQAIMRIKKHFDNLKDTLGRPEWATTMKMYSYVHGTNNWRYYIFSLTCQRVDYRDSIHGGMK